jgi:TetR/AcrR family transcriptional regulator, repressor for neighboring sulfatase
MQRMATARPRGRAEVVEALMESARKLIAERGPAVALREIADDAGVNFGLIYQYLGTKEQVVAEVYRHATEAAATRLAEAEHIDEALSLLMSLGDGTTARLIGWAALDSSQRADAFRDSPALNVLADFVVADADANGVEVSLEDAKAFAAFAMVISLGWRLFAPTALYAAGLDGRRPAKYDDHVQRYLDRLAEAVTHQPSDQVAAPKSAAPRTPRLARRGTRR